MKTIALNCRTGFVGGIVLLLGVLCRADDAGDSTLDFVQFKAPAGWKASESQAARIFTSPDSDATQQTIIILLVTPAQENLDLPAIFDQSVKQVTSGGKVLEASETSASKTRQGFDALSRTLTTQVEGQPLVYSRIIGAKVRNRMAGIFYLSTSKAHYEEHQKEMAALLQSVSFTDGAAAVNPLGAGAVNPLGAGTGTASAELAALAKQKQELLAKVAEIEARERQLGGATAQAGHAAVPQDDALAKAREQYTKGVAARRKPHVVSGDILGLDGKPIANVISYRVEVWGTTVAAERTTYSLEVDQNGHFEQQVPDGLYQVMAHCIVTQAGHRVPVDLVWLDDKKVGVVQASSAGIVRDFRLVIAGLRPGEDPKSDHAYFGGTLSVAGPPYTVTRGSFSTRHPGGHVILTLTAQSTLLDGSRMEPITIDVTVEEVNYSNNRRNIPMGVYKASAVLVAKDGGKTAMPIASNFNGPYGDSAEIAWESSRDNADQLTVPGLYLKD